jgi:hypothetical protein
MKRTWFVVVLCLACSSLFAVPARAEDRGHGAIYYSASGNRIGWAKSLGSDGDADQAAAAMCRGGQIDAVFLQEFQNQQAGVSATGTGPQIDVVESDCRKIIKFDSADNHQCAGFGFNGSGNVSNGVRKSDRPGVENSLSSWSQTFVICNDDRSVSGIERFANALNQLAGALNGSNNANSSQIAQPGNINATTVVFHNVTNATATVGLKCTNESSYHTFTVSAGGTQSIDGSSWGEGCATYDFIVTTPAADGSSTSVTHQIQGGRSYNVVFNQQKNAFDLGGGNSNLIIVNDTNIDLTYLVMCPSLSPSKHTIASGATSSTHLNCNNGTLQVATGTSTDATYKSFPVQNGKTYHLRFDPNAQVITIVSGP